MGTGSNRAFLGGSRPANQIMNEAAGTPTPERQSPETERPGKAGKVVLMSHHRRSWTRASAGIGVGLLALADAAIAADLPLKAPAARAVFDWTGLYIGAHAGFGGGSSHAVLTDPATSATRNVFNGMIGGVQAGYNYRLPSGLLL